MDDELVLLATHGVLHLLGYDHMEPDEEKEMFGLQQKLLDGWRSAPRQPVTGEPATREPGPR
jgi:probable rRNA maturation factor